MNEETAIVRQGQAGWKRSDQAMRVDQAEVVDLYYVKRLTKTEILRQLEVRAFVDYRYTESMLETDLVAIEGKVYDERGLEEIRRDIELQDMRLAAVEREAWSAWERSQEPLTVEKVMKKLHEWEEELIDGSTEKRRELLVSEIDQIVTERVGEGQWLKIILDAIEKRSKLRQLYKTKVDINIESQHTERRLEYRVVSPGMWRDDEAAKRVIEQADRKLIEEVGADALDILMPNVKEYQQDGRGFLVSENGELDE